MGASTPFSGKGWASATPSGKSSGSGIWSKGEERLRSQGGANVRIREKQRKKIQESAGTVPADSIV